ncbi:snRNA-activating protein complex subunit 1a [Trichomycterus rosablanca]|uniref:snRNA-activating protein complex subunit 1a n=1 Tax=Trichomycterus rosablanca TaxID=2290929 RepID=UPI002F35C922
MPSFDIALHLLALCLLFEAAARSCDVFWIPFKSDCEELLGRFQQTESVRYEDFAATWRSLDFSNVFYGMTARHEKRPFCRLVFTVVYDYFLPPYSFQIRVGALYMIYGLYYTQPVWPREKVWIAQKDWVHVQRFVSDAVSCQHLDVVYIYRKLVSEKAFLYTAMPKQLVFDSKRNFVNKDLNDEFQERPARVAELVNAGTLEEITNVQTHYERIKQAVSTSISVTPVNLTAQLEECALEFQKWQEENTSSKKKNASKKAEKNTNDNESSKRADLLASIKSKSYGQLSKASKSRRHRQVDMDTSGSGTDHAQESLMPCRKKQLSLRESTLQTLGPQGSEKLQHWLLSSKEEDKAALKRTVQKHRFRW